MFFILTSIHSYCRSPSLLVVTRSLRRHALKHARPPCPSPSPGVVHCISDAIQPSHPLMPSSPSALNLSQHQGLFQCVSCLYQMTISPSNEHSGLISLKTDWFDLLAIQGTLKSLLQHYSSKASILCGSAFFTILLLQPSVTTGKTIA